MADGDIKSISISVNAKTGTAVKNIDRLTHSLSRLASLIASMKNATINVGTMVQGLEKLSKVDLSALPTQMQKIASAMKEFTHLDALESKSMNAHAKMLAAQMREQEYAIKRQRSQTMADQERRLSLKDMTQQIGKTATGDTENKGFEVPDEIGKFDWSKMLSGMWEFNNNGTIVHKTLVLIAQSAALLGKMFAKAAVPVAKLTGKLAVAPFKKLASSISGAVKSLRGFLAAVKRIAVYRAIRTALKEIAQAFREGVDNLYQYSKAINGQFAKSMDMLATSALYAKNSLGAMSAPIINSLAPAVDMITDKFVDLLNTINELVASLTGAETWTAALKYPKEYAEEMDSAAGSAKKLRATLLGFDEINRLDDNNKGSRGRAGEELDYSKMFEERTVSMKAKSVIQAIKDAFASGDLTDFGKTIGEKIKKGLDDIDWESIKERANKNAGMVASFINGMISVNGLGSTLGETIAEAFNVAVGKIKTFFDRVEWRNLGIFVADGFNSIVETFSFSDLGASLASIINGGVNALSGFIDNVKWDKFGEFLSSGINRFFNDINTKKLASTICDGIINALKAVSSFLKATDFEQIGAKIVQFFKGIKWADMLFSVVPVIFNAISAVARLLWGAVKELFAPIGKWFADLFAGAWEGIKTAWGGVTAWFANLYQGIINGFKGIGLFFRDKFVEAKQGVTNAFASVGTFFADKATAVKSSFTNIGTWFKDKFNGAARGVKDAFSSIGLFFSDTWSNIKGAFKDTVSWFQQKFESVWRAIKEPFKQVGLFFSDIWDTIKKKFTDIGQKIGNAVGKAFATAINAVLTAVEKIINAPIKAINALLDVVNKLPGIKLGKLDTITFKKLNVDEFAKGGAPDAGSLFLAGERGAEIIASSHGHTQVSNRDQIAESVAAGNEETLAALLEQNSILRQLLAKDTTVVTNITTDSITNALDRQNRRNGRAIVPVGG